MAAKAPKAERKLVVCIMSGYVATKDEPRGVGFLEGQQFAADDEVVKRAPRFFLPVTSTAAEVAAARAALVDWTPAGNPPGRFGPEGLALNQIYGR